MYVCIAYIHTYILIYTRRDIHIIHSYTHDVNCYSIRVRLFTWFNCGRSTDM